MPRVKLRTSGYRKPAVQYDKDEGLVPWHEIASAIGTTPEGARVIAQRALDKIRKSGMMKAWEDYETALGERDARDSQVLGR